MVPSSPSDTTDGTSASPDASRMTTRHAVAARRRRGCSSCRDRCRRPYPWLRRAGCRLAALPGPIRDLAFDGRQQVVDVVPLEQPLAQRLERRALLRGGAPSPGCPSVRSAPASCALVLVALRVDRLRAPTRAARAAPPDRAPDSRSSRISSSSSFSANTSSSSAGGTFAPLPSSDFAGRQALRSRAGARCARPDCAARDTRRSDTTTARGWRAVPSARAL